MKLFTYDHQEKLKLGVQTEKGFLAIADTQQKGSLPEVPTDIMEVINGGTKALEQLGDFIQQAEQNNATVYLDEDAIAWGPCVTQPQKIICVGLNYRRHADETNAPYPETPILFNKFNNTLAGHKEEIPVPEVTDKLDYEVELGVVIGQKTKNSSEEDALSKVFGYFTANDLSARDLQMRTPQWLLGKTCDKFSPIGPVVVTADEIKDPQNLTLKTVVNGEVRQNSNTSDMIFTIKEIVSYISKHMTLEPGDLILTGTPEGVVLGAPEAEQVYLQPGDTVDIEIEHVGSLSNTFIKERA
ncbi:fumarylacetoacetate hydrolase family protein [Aureibacillus halotolerans]|uniref:2-keto-4-pentenoate hydratase/2-oxohepta-3-ene-1,7-dioic acid hydratase in catechol pathway n=1 Tax=Aureibacillus halotolerans TaxID=1508390 RepID=A0A4R6TUX2_9BACI|nr:fumarylacetoacetate hydrolase family protein [Aureibacillus halotolerans]TDQ36432.1 2-keto-4-pentenoate hydratase/2-oxohepta-3-ene-1,7-dioic acid hydratase in catechol pathway [Aureibacillus halotolerans]